jgi:tetratricopeptide (TPR) repeat protein
MLRVAACVAAIILITALAYLPSINGGFIWDDHQLLTENRIIPAADGLYRLWCTTESPDFWPMTYSTFWIEWRLWGMHQIGYHATNLMLHILGTLLIWIGLRRLSIPGAFLAAAIFAVHPVNVESVAWIAQRKNLMAMLLFLLSILFYLKDIKRADMTLPAANYPLPTSSSFMIHHSSFRSTYWLSLAAFVLAMLSKGSVAILPVVLLGAVWRLRPINRRDLVQVVPFFVVAVGFTAVNVWFQTLGMEESIRTATFTDRLLGAGGIVWFYLYKSALPFNLIFVYPMWHVRAENLLWWCPLVAVLAVTAVLWWFRNSWSRPLLFAWGFFCVALVPVLGFADVYFMKFSLVADHYQHIALIGVAALAAAAFDTWRGRVRGYARRAATGAAIVVLGALAILTWRQNGMYIDESTVYRTTIEKNPSCWMAHANLGNILLKAGRWQDAIPYFEKTLELKPDFAEAGYDWGNALYSLGKFNEAAEHYRQAVRVKPKYAEAYNNLGNALLAAGRLPDAISQYRQAIRCNPDFALAHLNLGNALGKTGDLPEAIDQYRQALHLQPDYAEGHNSLGILLVSNNKLPEAIAHYNEAIRLRPGYVEARSNLGAALMRSGKPREAIDQYRQALQLKPDFPEINFNLALAYSETGQTTEAVAAAEKAFELARARGQTPLAGQIDQWLKSYRADLSNPPIQHPHSKSTPPVP